MFVNQVIKPKNGKVREYFCDLFLESIDFERSRLFFSVSLDGSCRPTERLTKTITRLFNRACSGVPIEETLKAIHSGRFFVSEHKSNLYVISYRVELDTVFVRFFNSKIFQAKTLIERLEKLVQQGAEKEKFGFKITIVDKMLFESQMSFIELNKKRLRVYQLINDLFDLGSDQFDDIPLDDVDNCDEISEDQSYSLKFLNLNQESFGHESCTIRSSSFQGVELFV